MRRRRLLPNQVPYQEVLLTSLYLRHNVSHVGCGAIVSADSSVNRFHEVVPVLHDEYRLASDFFPMIAAATMGLVYLARLVTGYGTGEAVPAPARLP